MNDGDTKIIWHTGETHEQLYNVVFLQADGDELDHIRKHIQNIPMSDKRVVRWYAPFAQFIWDNLA